MHLANASSRANLVCPVSLRRTGWARGADRRRSRARSRAPRMRSRGCGVGSSLLCCRWRCATSSALTSGWVDRSVPRLYGGRDNTPATPLCRRYAYCDFAWSGFQTPGNAAMTPASHDHAARLGRPLGGRWRTLASASSPRQDPAADCRSRGADTQGRSAEKTEPAGRDRPVLVRAAVTNGLLVVGGADIVERAARTSRRTQCRAGPGASRRPTGLRRSRWSPCPQRAGAPPPRTALPTLHP